MTLRCNPHLDLDLPLLTFLAVAEARNVEIKTALLWGNQPVVPYAILYGEFGQFVLESIKTLLGFVLPEKDTQGGNKIRYDSERQELSVYRMGGYGRPPEPLQLQFVENIISSRIIDKHIAVLRVQPIA